MKAQKALFLADIHLPYHDAEALNSALLWAKKREVDHIILGGDILDCAQISSYSKDPAMAGMKEELAEGRKFLARLRKMFPEAKITYCIGNHERRLEKYIWDHAGKIAGLVHGLLEHHLGFKELGVEYKKEPWMLGDLLVLHGDQLNGRGGVNIPDTLYKQLGMSAICGHFHRSQIKSFKNFKGDRFVCASVGYLALPQDYCPVNQWALSFAWIEVKSTGKFKIELHDIVDGEVE